MEFSESQSFVPIYKIESSFDSTNRLSTETKFKWYSELGIFKPSFKMEFLTILETDTNLNRKGILF